MPGDVLFLDWTYTIAEGEQKGTVVHWGHMAVVEAGSTDGRSVTIIDSNYTKDKGIGTVRTFTYEVGKKPFGEIDGKIFGVMRYTGT